MALVPAAENVHFVQTSRVAANALQLGDRRDALMGGLEILAKSEGLDV